MVLIKLYRDQEWAMQLTVMSATFELLVPECTYIGY